MKSSARILLLISSILFLSACGSDDEELSIFGLWENTSGGVTSYYSFTSQQIKYYTYTEEYQCHSSRTIPISSLTSSSITSTDAITDSYTIVNNVLTIEEDFILTRSTVIPKFLSCSDPSTTGTLTVEVEFDYLPETFSIQNGTDEYLSSFYLDIKFDLSPSDSIDTKLWNIIADYSFKGIQNSNTVSMNDLSSGTYFYTGGDRDISLTSAPYSINENTITFSFNRNEHKIFKEITNTSSINIYASFKDINGDTQSDTYPNSGYTGGIVLTDALDATGDVSGNYQYQTIVDIKSVTVTVTE